jgi:hypothetical protein
MRKLSKAHHAVRLRRNGHDILAPMNWWPALEIVMFAAIAFILGYLFTRNRARESEVRRIRRRVEELSEMTRKTMELAKGAEAGRIDMNAALDRLSSRVDVLTDKTETIRNQLSAKEWDRQWEKKERIQAFSQYLGALEDVTDAFEEIHTLMETTGQLNAALVPAFQTARRSLIRADGMLLIFGESAVFDIQERVIDALRKANQLVATTPVNIEEFREISHVLVNASVDMSFCARNGLAIGRLHANTEQSRQESPNQSE